MLAARDLALFYERELLPAARAHPGPDAAAVQRDVQGRLRPAAREAGGGRVGEGDGWTPGGTTGSRGRGWSARWADRCRRRLKEGRDDHAATDLSRAAPWPPAARRSPTASRLFFGGTARADAGGPYTPVVTPDGATLPFVMKGGVKEFRLIGGAGAAGVRARHDREHAGATTAARPVPTIEAVEGDRIRVLRHEPPARSTRRSTGTASCCRTAWTASAGLHAAAHQAGRDLRLRVHAAPARHVHVPPARRRDGADGDGHDGLLRHPSAARRGRRIDRDFCHLRARVVRSSPARRRPTRT